jgi:hypothetical protein
LYTLYTEPEFVNLLRSPGIDSQPAVPERQPYLTHRPARLHRLAESIRGLLKRLQIWAQEYDKGVAWIANSHIHVVDSRQSASLLYGV